MAQKILAIMIGLSAILFFSGQGDAKVTGTQCSSCHTMHNSQSGSDMRGLKAQDVAGAGSEACNSCHQSNRPVLLRLDCLGCHAEDPAGASSIGSFNAPQVAHNNGVVDPSLDLSAGNFKYVFGGDSEAPKGHNVHGFATDFVSEPDIIYGNTGGMPPGYNSGYDPSSAKWDATNSGGSPILLCAGANGCHGNRDETSMVRAMRGSHHADDSSLKFGAGFTETGQGSTVGKSYRFLYKVKGGEDADWQQTTGANDHNEYKGKTYAARAAQAWGTIETISEFCAECHGVFHMSSGITAGSGSPWLRHPTDALLPGSGEYSAYTQWSFNAPVARPVLANAITPDGLVHPGTDIVMCLSCHKAHASENNDSLRWAYDGVARPTGCVTCHTQK